MKIFGWILILIGFLLAATALIFFSGNAKIVWISGAFSVFSVFLGSSFLLFNKAFELRKKVVLVSQIICLGLILVGVILSSSDLPGGHPIALLGGSILAFFVSPLSFVNKYDKWKFYSKTKTEAFVLSFSDLIGKAGIILGLLFRFMHWPYANNMILLGGSIYIISTLIWNRAFQKEVVRRKEAEDNITLQKRKIEVANKALNQQNEEIKIQRDEIEKQRDIVIEQKEEIEAIHHEIAESINYATRLQAAILPDEKMLDEFLSERFVLFKPKDKVSGDFYWWSQREIYTVIAAADSTGHGVPGAFMSMLGSSLLREIVQKEGVTDTAEILEKLRIEIVNSLKQKGEVGEQKDGMDIALIAINHKSNIVQFSGANNPLYILTNRPLKDRETSEELENFYEIKPDKMPIAIYDKMDPFTSHKIQLEKGDQLYLFSDGFADQFGGTKGKKFKYKAFKHVLSSNRNKSMTEQKACLEHVFVNWKGRVEQVDDVLVLGIKL